MIGVLSSSCLELYLLLLKKKSSNLHEKKRCRVANCGAFSGAGSLRGKQSSTVTGIGDHGSSTASSNQHGGHGGGGGGGGGGRGRGRGRGGRGGRGGQRRQQR